MSKHSYYICICFIHHLRFAFDSALARGRDFESKGHKLSSSAECRIRALKLLRHQIAGRLNAHSQTDWAIDDQTQTWTQPSVPMIWNWFTSGSGDIRSYIYIYTKFIYVLYILYMSLCVPHCFKKTWYVLRKDYSKFFVKLLVFLDVYCWTFFSIYTSNKDEELLRGPNPASVVITGMIILPV